MKHLVAVSFALLAGCGGTTAITSKSTTPAPPEPARPTGPRMIKKGEQLGAMLLLGETHIYTIDLAASEKVHVTIEGESGPNGAGSGCGNWGYGWHQPNGSWLTGNPLPLAPNDDGTGMRTMSLDFVAEIHAGGDVTPTAGLWELHVDADPANCARIDYRVRAE